MSVSRRTVASVALAVFVASIGWTESVRAAAPPTITLDADMVEVTEQHLAMLGGTWTELDGDPVAFSATLGQIEADRNVQGRWSWDLPTEDGPFTTEVTVTISDADGSASATFRLSVTNKDPIARTEGPPYVPSSSASDREFLWRAADVPADTLNTTIDCGSGTLIAQYPTHRSGQYGMRCHFSVEGPTRVGVRSTDDDGGHTDGRIDVIATPKVKSVADAHLRIDGFEHQQLGGALATPDLNGDGYADVVLGGTATTNSAPVDPGYVQVVLGRSGPGVVELASLTSEHGFRIDGPPGVGFGRTLAAPGDINGDGLDDLLIGSSDAGAHSVVHVVFGSPSIDDLDVRVILPGQGATIRDADGESWLGRSLAGIGDVNGDGRSDLAVGGDSIAGGTGRAAVIYGRAGFSGVDLADLAPNEGFLIAGMNGGMVSFAGGDVNGDGRSDLIVASDFGWVSAAHVIYGRSGIDSIDVQSLSPSQGFRIGGGEGLRITALASGDMDGDGFAEVVLVHDGWSHPSGWAASIVRGASTNATIEYLETASRSRLLRIVDDGWGLSSDATTLDWDGNGRADLVLGSVMAEHNGMFSGSAFLVPGAATLTDVDLGTLSSGWLRFDADNPEAFAADAVAAGDVTGDGVDDLLVGAPGITAWDGGAGKVGRVGVFRGDATDSTPPTVSAVRRALPLGKALVGSSPIVRVTWDGFDSGTGVQSYEIARQRDGGAWSALGIVTARAFESAFATGHDYRFRVRGRDRAGNLSAWAYGSSFRLVGYHETSSKLSYRGTWLVGRSSSYAGGTTRYARAAGKRASLTFTGREVAFAAPVGPSRGRADIYINGSRVGSVNLYSSTSKSSRVLGSWSWSTSATRTISVRVVGTKGHPRVDIDRFVVVR